MTPDDFLDQLLPAAMTCHQTDGIPASFTLAQAALESTWGRSDLAVKARNIFSVKADPAWRGPTLDMQTGEVLNGRKLTVPAKWRVYGSWLECIKDRTAFLRMNKRRYAACFNEPTGEGWARAIAAAGYATDPKYADKLISIINGRNLTRFDQPEGEKK